MNPITIISVGLNILVLLINIVIFITIKFNDLRHLSIKVDKIDKKLDRLFNKMEKVEKSHFAMKAVCDERHKNN